MEVFTKIQAHLPCLERFGGLKSVHFELEEIPESICLPPKMLFNAWVF